ncbi:MAG: HAD family phosphatase [Chloroflexota bacterium]
MTDLRPSTVIFDLGAVLIDWDPRYVYRDLFPGDTAGMEAFLADVTSATWNHQMDAGKPWADAIAELVAIHPERRELIEAYWTRWPEMLHSDIPGTVAILRELRDAGVRILALTNWSAETFPVARERFDFLGWFEGIVVSGEEGVAKPDPAIFELLLERYGVDARTALFVDDRAENVAAAEALGMGGVVFTSPGALRTALEDLGLLPAGTPA